MDSRKVSTKIRARVRPALRANGFARFTERNSWRDLDEIIHVVNFQSFNSYNAEVIGATTYSFSVNLGILLPNIPPTHGADSLSIPPKPHEYECHLRSSLARSFSQVELQRRDIWYVDPEADYLDRCIADVIDQLGSAAEPWFQQYSELSEVLQLLLGSSLDDPQGRVWGFGNPGSPLRNYNTGYVALALGQRELACVYLQRAAEHFRANERLAADIDLCRAEA